MTVCIPPFGISYSAGDFAYETKRRRGEMLDYINACPQPAFFVDSHGIAAMNEKAQVLFPRIRTGDEIPDVLVPPEGERIWEGAAAVEGRVYQIRCEQQNGGYFYTFQPRQQLALSDGQLDGALYQKIEKMMKGGLIELV